MKEQRSFHSAAEQPPVPTTNLNRIGIEIHFGESVAKIITIRRQHIDVAMNICSIHLKPVYRQAHEAQLAVDPSSEALQMVDTQVQMIFASRSGRWGR